MALPLVSSHLPTASSTVTDSSGMEPSGFGADVEQIVAASSVAVGDIGDDTLGRLPAVVEAVEAPTIVEGHAAFPRTTGLGSADFLLGRGEIAFEAVAVIDDDLRLQVEDHLVHALRLPPFGRERPVDVVPEHVDFAVVGHQLADKAVGVGDEALARLLAGLAFGAVGMVPVHERVIEAHAEAFGTGGVDVLADKIAARTLLGCAIVGELGIPMAETFVVL